MFSGLIMHMCHLQFDYCFMKESRSFLQAVLVQEAEEETVTLLRETGIYFKFGSSLCKASVEQTHQKAAE